MGGAEIYLKSSTNANGSGWSPTEEQEVIKNIYWIFLVLEMRYNQEDSEREGVGGKYRGNSNMSESELTYRGAGPGSPADIPYTAFD